MAIYRPKTVDLQWDTILDVDVEGVLEGRVKLTKDLVLHVCQAKVETDQPEAGDPFSLIQLWRVMQVLLETTLYESSAYAHKSLGLEQHRKSYSEETDAKLKTLAEELERVKHENAVLKGEKFGIVEEAKGPLLSEEEGKALQEKVRKIQEQYTAPRPPPAWPPCTLCNDGSGGGPGGDDEAEDGPGGGAAAAEGPRRKGRQGRTAASAVCRGEGSQCKIGGKGQGAGGGQQGGGGQGQRRATVQEHEGHAGPEERAAARRPRPPAEVRGGAPWPHGGGLRNPAPRASMTLCLRQVRRMPGKLCVVQRVLWSSF